MDKKKYDMQYKNYKEKIEKIKFIRKDESLLKLS